MKKNKLRVNITVDADTLAKAKTKLHLFGGKLSTLFNAYLEDFVESIDEKFSGETGEMKNKMEELEGRLTKLEERLKGKSIRKFSTKVYKE